MRRLVWLLLLTGAALAAPAETPPEVLYFGLHGLQQRVRLDPPPTARSGGLLFRLVGLDRLAGESGGSTRLLLSCSAANGQPVGELVVNGEVYAATASGELPVRSYQCHVAGAVTWLAVTLAGEVRERLTAFGAAVGPPPREAETVVPLSLEQLGQSVWLPAVGQAVSCALARRERAVLPIPDEPPPLYRGLESTAGGEAGGSDGQLLTLRLFTLAPRAEGQGWRLANLRLPGATQVTDWRYGCLPWRPDWGGWLGAKGTDWEAPQPAGGPRRGVVIETLAADGPGAAAGLRPGDILAAVDGAPVADAFSLGERVRTSTPGAALQCEVWRDGRRLTLPVRLGSRSLWPEVDELEFKQAWQQLGAVLPAGQQEQLLCLWDWQTRTPVAAQLPPTIELLFRRTAPLESTTFLFRGVPASP